MAFIPTPNTARCAIRMHLFGQNVVNTLWFDNEGSPYDATALGLLGSGILGWWINHVAPNLSNNVTIQDITCTAQDTSTSPAVVTSTALTPGEIAQGALPGSVCIVVKFNTVGRGRSSRGRNFVSGLPEGSVLGNTIDPSDRSAILAGYAQLNAEVSGSGIHVVVSKQLDGVARTEGFVQPVTGYTIVNDDVDSMRKRLTGRGT